VPLAANAKITFNGRVVPLAQAFWDGAERTVYRARFTPETAWVLGEHRIVGRPTVPGTTYLEMARAALAFAAAEVAQRPIEIREAVFLTPLAVDPGEAVEVATELLGSGDRRSFRVVSQGPAGEREHARGTVGGGDALPDARRDVAALLALCPSVREVEAGEGAPAGDFLVTGPRWQSLRRLHLGPEGESLAELELDPRFHGDLADFALHPALLDVAAGAVQLLGEGHYLPLAYERLTVHRPLPERGYSHFRLQSAGDVLTADLEILDAAGELAVAVEGFAMKRVSAEAAAELARPAAVAAPAPRPAGGGGIAPAEGRQLFGRLLAAGMGPRVVISTRDLGAVRAEPNGDYVVTLSADPGVNVWNATSLFAPTKHRFLGLNYTTIDVQLDPATESVIINVDRGVRVGTSSSITVSGGPPEKVVLNLVGGGTLNTDGYVDPRILAPESTVIVRVNGSVSGGAYARRVDVRGGYAF